LASAVVLRPQVLMRRIRKLAPALLVAIFWIAQVQGTVHGISHMGGAASVSDRSTVPHVVFCVECAAFAQAGAAPVLTLPATPPAEHHGGVVDAPSVIAFSAAPTAAYRSRAPPLSPS
jgi:hypothetical protein